MKIDAVDIFALIPIALMLIGFRPVRPFSAFNPDYISVDTGKSLRGIFALTVMYHHLAQVTTRGALFGGFSHIGYFCVGVFFFLSGFGLEKSYIRSKNYKNKFLRKRITPVLIPYIATMAIYCILLFSLFPTDDAGKLFSDAIEAGNSWYIIAIISFYIAFWLLMLICKDNYSAMLTGAFVWFVAYYSLCKIMNLSPWWYNATVLLIVGMAWALYEEKILRFIKKHYYTVFLLSVIILGVTTVGRYKADRLLPIPDIKIFSTSMSAAFFVILVLLISMKSRIGNKALAFFGEISLEIYLLHGAFILMLRGSSVKIENDFLFVLISAVGSIILAYALHTALKPLIKRIRNA